MSNLIALCQHLEDITITITTGYIRSYTQNLPSLVIIHLCAIFFQCKDYFCTSIFSQESYVISNHGHTMRRLMQCEQESSPEMHNIYGINVINTLNMFYDVEFEWVLMINDMKLKHSNSSKQLYIGLINKSNNDLNSASRYYEYYAINIQGNGEHSPKNSFNTFTKQEFKNINVVNSISRQDIIRIIFQKIHYNKYNILFFKKKKLILKYSDIFTPAHYRLFIHSEQYHTLITVLNFRSKGRSI